MEKKPKTRLKLKVLMIRYSLLIVLFLLFHSCNNKKEQKVNQTDKTVIISKNEKLKEKGVSQGNNPKMKALGYFDYDNTKDTIYYFLDKTKGEPIFNCEIYFGNKKQSKFFISTGSGYIQLSNNKKGCIEKSEITTGNYSSEEIERYEYDEKLENWFIIETVSKSDNKIVTNNKFEERWSIDDEMVIK